MSDEVERIREVTPKKIPDWVIDDLLKKPRANQPGEENPDWEIRRPYQGIKYPEMIPPTLEPITPDPEGTPEYVQWVCQPGSTCEVCLSCQAEGVVPYGHVFKSGTTGPLAHYGCLCGLKRVVPDPE